MHEESILESVVYSYLLLCFSACGKSAGGSEPVLQEENGGDGNLESQTG